MLSIKKFIFILTLSGLFAPLFVIAAEEAPRDIPLTLMISILGQGQVASLASYIGLVYQYLVGIAGIVAVAMIMYGGVKWIFAGGDSGKIGAAKETITNAVIGLILALGSYVILNTINPNLLTLRMPGITRLGTTMLLGRAQWCPNEGSYRNRWNCGVPSTVSEPGFVGQCIGRGCPDGFECYGEQGSTSRGLNKCINTNACPNTCSDVNTLNTDSDRKRVVCTSGACRNLQCFLESLAGLCMARGTDGSSCLTEYADSCRIGLWCAPGGTCRHLNVPLAEGITCTENSQCASQICKESRLGRECAPAGGARLGESCGSDQDCGAPSSGRVCNELTLWPNTCITRGSLGAGSYCENNEACVSGRCERRGIDIDKSCQ